MLSAKGNGIGHTEPERGIPIILQLIIDNTSCTITVSYIQCQPGFVFEFTYAMDFYSL